MAAAGRLKKVVARTPLTYNHNLSRKYACNVFLKREDLQIVRSYKLRGAYNMMVSLPKTQLQKGVVCASAGNHAQGFAYSCRKLGVKGVVFMPIITPKQKVTQTRMFGEDNIEIVLTGDTFDDCAVAARQYTDVNGMTFIPPFEDPRIIEGQGTVAVEILEDQPAVDYLFIPVGGGGLASGVGSYFKAYSPGTKIIGVEPEGAPSMKEALKAGHPITLGNIERFVDGAAVKRVGDLTFSICREVLDDMHLVPVEHLELEPGVIALPHHAIDAGIRIFQRDADGRRPAYGGTEKCQSDPHFRDLIQFHEYFHGDNGAGLGASHQTGWTGLVAKLIQMSGPDRDEEFLQQGRAAVAGHRRA